MHFGDFYRKDLQVKYAVKVVFALFYRSRNGYVFKFDVVTLAGLVEWLCSEPLEAAVLDVDVIHVV